MKNGVIIILKALIIAACASSVGLALNMVSSNSVPLVYERPKEISIGDLKLPLIDENEAKKLFDKDGVVFVDTRAKEDFAKGHVKGAILLPQSEKEEYFTQVQVRLPEDAELILYCHGPECDMAEHVAEFLSQLGYTKMMIMVSGFPAWRDAGYPVGKSASGGDE